MRNVCYRPDREPAEAGHARAALARMCAAGFLGYCSYTICRSPLLPLYARQLGADPPTIGIIVAASTLTGVVLKLPAGALSDIIGRRALLTSGALVFALMPYAYPAVSTLAALIVVRVVHGSATAIFSPVAAASVSDIAPVSRRATWLSTYATVQGIGQTLAPVVAGYLIAGGRFDLAFGTAAALGFMVPIIVIGWRNPPPSVPQATRWREFTSGIVEAGRDRLVLATSAAQAAHFVLNGTLNAFLPLHGRETLGLTAAELGWMFGLQTVTTLAVRPALGMLSDRLGRRVLIATGLAVCSGAVALVPLASDFEMLIAAIIGYAAGAAATTSAAGAFITDISSRARYGAAHGVFGMIYDIGDALGPIVAGLLVASLGYARMFQTMAGVAAVIAIVFALSSRPRASGRGPC